MKWFRLYSEVLHDPKVQRLTPALFKHWINLLCLANESEPRGTLPSADDIAFALRIKPSDAHNVIAQLVRAGVIDSTPDGRHLPHNWPQRQRASDDIAARVRGHRERKSADIQDSEATPAPDVTLHETLQVTQVKRSVDTDTDTDTDSQNKVSKGKRNISSLHAAADADGVGAEADSLVITTPKPARKAAPNPHWDALVQVLGFAPTTEREKRIWGKAVHDLKAANATPEDVRRRAARYVERYGADRLTVNALVTHWSECDPTRPLPAAKANGHTPRAAPEPPAFDLYQPPTAVNFK